MAPGWWQQRLGGYASTATPWQLRRDSIALMVVAWRLGVVVHAPDHDDDQGVAQTNDKQHRDHRHGERRLIKAPLGFGGHYASTDIITGIVTDASLTGTFSKQPADSGLTILQYA